MNKPICLFLGLAIGATGLARAQQPASPFATVRGYVFDSLLTLTTLPGASVVFAGPASRSVVADGRGRFLVDSLPPGTYKVGFAHPTLDAVGYTPPERTVELRAGVSRLFLSTTAGTGIYARLCPEGREDQTGMVLGGLVEVNTQRPVADGEVRIEWSESTISRELGLSRRVRVARSPTDSLGRFRICGVPNDAAVLLRAHAKGFDGPPLELNLSGRSIAVRTLSIDLADSAARVANNGVLEKGTAILKGSVLQENGQPVPEAQVLVLGLSSGTKTTPTGTFEMTELPGGTHTVEIRAIGFGRKREMVDLRPGQPVELDVKLAAVAPVLPELSVTAKAAAQSEFDQRRSMGGGGHFITRDDIERRNPLRTEDLFRAVPGFTVVPSGGFDYQIVSSRGVGFQGRCSPDFYIDGAKVTVDPQIAGGIPVNPGEIHGIEVYSGAANTPAQFQTPNGCGAIVIWTRRGESRRTRR